MPKKQVQTFNDGVLDIYTVRDDDCIELMQEGIRFGLRTVGSKRFFAAKDYQHSADRLIRVPYREIPANTVVIIGSEQYDVLQSQEILDTFPRCCQLTLERIKEENAHDLHTDA